MTHTVRQFLEAPKTSALWELMDSEAPEHQWFKGEFDLTFDNGEVVRTNGRYVIISSYCWNIFRMYPKVVITPRHFIKSAIGDGRFTTTSHLTLLERIIWDTYDAYIANGTHYDLLDTLTKAMYRITNELDCEMVKHTKAWISGLDAMHMLAMLRDPELVALRKEAALNRRMMGKIDKRMRDIISTAPRFKGNPIQSTWRSGIVKKDQVMQVVGFCGEMTDIDGHYFHRMPVMRNYGQGLRTAFDSGVESRFTAKALDATSEQIKRTEYFNRRLQLLCQVLRNVHHGDCGTTQTMEYYVKRNSVHTLEGMNHVVDGVVKYVRKDSYELEGTKIYLRVPHRCATRDSYGICSVCLGRSSETVPANSNIGHLYATYIAAIISQAVLGAKHKSSDLDSSAYVIAEYCRQYIDTTPDGTGIYFSPKLQHLKPKMYISKREAENLPDIFNIEDIDDVSLSRFTELSEVMLFLTTNEKQIPISVSHHKSRSSLSHEFLKYLKQTKWEVVSNSTYCIDLSGWNWDEQEPVFILPRMQLNMSDVAANIEKHIESNTRDKVYRSNINYTPDLHLCKLIDVINEQLNINVAAIAVVAYCTMIRSDEKKDYGLPKVWTDSAVSIKSDIFVYRSFGQLLPFERITKQITNPESYTIKKRPDAPFDFVFMPEEVSAANKL